MTVKFPDAWVELRFWHMPLMQRLAAIGWYHWCLKPRVLSKICCVIMGLRRLAICSDSLCGQGSGSSTLHGSPVMWCSMAGARCSV